MATAIVSLYQEHLGRHYSTGKSYTLLLKNAACSPIATQVLQWVAIASCGYAANPNGVSAARYTLGNTKLPCANAAWLIESTTLFANIVPIATKTSSARVSSAYSRVSAGLSCGSTLFFTFPHVIAH